MGGIDCRYVKDSFKAYLIYQRNLSNKRIYSKKVLKDLRALQKAYSEVDPSLNKLVWILACSGSS